jgi:hypothetical protein
MSCRPRSTGWPTKRVVPTRYRGGFGKPNLPIGT